MKLSLLLSCLFSTVCALGAINDSLPDPAAKGKHTFSHTEKAFTIDGKPIQLISGEIHYPRVPREYWRDRMKRAKSMGLNTICTYLFWNLHEPQPGKWDFSGNLDIVEFCRIAQEEGLWVIVRPGPYICAEWEWGGFPAWLLKSPDIKVRSMDPQFMKPAMEYLKKVSSLLAPLQSTNGGPIIMAQVENEYGSFEADKEFLKAHRQAMKDGGLDGVLLFTSDGPNDSMITNGTLPDVVSVMNFGGDPEGAFTNFKKHRPNAPWMSGEFWCGWFDHWGKPHSIGDTTNFTRSLKWMLRNNVSPNMFMVHGGTSFGFMNGANWTGTYAPDVTSYDYGAPIAEDGTLTQRYHEFRNVIQNHLGKELPAPPPSLPKITLEPIAFSADNCAGMFENLPTPVISEQPRKMEDLGQSYGYILYRTKIKGPLKGTLKLTDLQDRAIITVDGVKIGTVDRRHGKDSLPVALAGGTHILDILVENMGRINFSAKLRDERKGLGAPVTIGKTPLKNFAIYTLPCDDLSKLKFKKGTAPGKDQPIFYKASFNVDKPGDTFLDMQDGWKKGVVWVNGRNLGRFWQIGAQQTLYCPAPFLKQGENEIVVLDLEGGIGTVKGIEKPVWKVNPEELGSKHRQQGETVTTEGLAPIHKASFQPGATRQNIGFVKPAAGRYVAIEVYNAHDSSKLAAMAELLFRDEFGQPIPQEECKLLYADSEETVAEAGSADQLFDNQPTTNWHTQWQDGEAAYPHLIVIDLGKTRKIKGFYYIPRQDKENGRVKDYAVFVSDKPFPGQK